jgi:hypothetical protein
VMIKKTENGISSFAPDKRLREVLIPSLSTTMLYNSQKYPSAEASKVFALFGGTGAAVEYSGIGVSSKLLADTIIEEGGDAYAFQNPLYYNSDNPSGRGEIIEKYKSLESQTRWMAHCLEFLLKQQSESISGGHKSLWIATQSTSTGVLLQLIDDYFHNKQYAKIVERIEGGFVTGLLGYEPILFEAWLAKEKDFLRKAGKADELVLATEETIWPHMTWASKGKGGRVSRNTYGPKLFFMGGTNDPLISPNDQLKVLRAFYELHPQLDITMVLSDTFHIPFNRLKYKNIKDKIVKAGVMDRVNPYIKSIVRGHSSFSIPGLKINKDSYYHHSRPICNDIF